MPSFFLYARYSLRILVSVPPPQYSRVSWDTPAVVGGWQPIHLPTYNSHVVYLYFHSTYNAFFKVALQLLINRYG